MNEEKPKYFWLVIILVIFLVTLGILVYYIRFRTSLTPSADTYNTVNVVSLSNSYVFSSPVRAKASGDLIRITVFILDEEGNGIFDKKVGLRMSDSEASSLLQIKDIQSLTDETGKAIFDITSDTVGTYQLEAFTDETILPQMVKVVFD